MLRIEMLEQHEAHAGVARQPFEKLREGLEAARRGSDADHHTRLRGTAAVCRVGSRAAG